MGKSDRYNIDGAEDDLGSQRSSTRDDTTDRSQTEDDSGNDRSADAIPHRVRFDSPKDNRKAKTFYLDADRDLRRLRQLHSLAETEFDEKVHRLDVYLAAFRSDLSDEDFLAEMRSIGYGYFD